MNLSQSNCSEGTTPQSGSPNGVQSPSEQQLSLSTQGRWPYARLLQRATPEQSVSSDSPDLVSITLRVILGGAFIMAGVLKIADPAKFALDVSHYRLAPSEMINLIAILIPWIEVTAGILVVSGIWLRAATLVILGLTVMFLFVISSALVRGLNIECGCFGTVGGKHVGWVNLAIDATLFLLALVLVRRADGKQTRREASGKPDASKLAL